MNFIDFETYSDVDLKKCGVYRYTEDPSTNWLCLVVNEDLHVNGFHSFSLGETLIAHNAQFERLISWKVLDMPYTIQQYVCTMALASYYSLPKGLGMLADVLNLPQKKDTRGTRLITKLCTPRGIGKVVVQDWYDLYSYCLQDVKTTKAFYDYISPYGYPKIERKIYELDQKINDRGIKIDIELVEKFIQTIKDYTIALNDRFHEITMIPRATMNLQFLKWLQEIGLKISDVALGTLRELHNSQRLKDICGANYTITFGSSKPTEEIKQYDYVNEAIGIRLQLSKSSTAKYEALKNVTCMDGRARGLLLYYGAQTGRWAGRLFQPQNLPRGNSAIDVENIFSNMEWVLTSPPINFMDMASACIRGMLTASTSDHQLLCVDYSSIETRVLFWLAGDDKGLAAFKEGRDIYKDMAASIYATDVSTITKQQRQLGKTAILGLGYGMGKAKFLRTCEAQGIEITEELANRAVDAYRSRYASVVNLWYSLDREAKDCMNGKITKRFTRRGDFLQMELPAGRCINYFKPELQNGEYGKELTYMSTNSITRKFERTKTYGGKLVENMVQGIARDILADAMLELDRLGFSIVLTVHDEIICDEKITDYEHNLAKMCEVMEEEPTWATGIPLAVEGFATYRYRK